MSGEDGFSQFFEGGTGIVFEQLEGFNDIQQLLFDQSLNESIQELVGQIGGSAQAQFDTTDFTFVDASGVVFRIPPPPRSGNPFTLYSYRCGDEQRTIPFNQITLGARLCPVLPLAQTSPTQQSVFPSGGTLSGVANSQMAMAMLLGESGPAALGGGVSFLDGVFDVLGEVGGFLLDTAGAAGSFIANNPQQVAQVAQLLGLIPQPQVAVQGMNFNAAAALQQVLAAGANGSGGGGMMVENADTGSLVSQLAGAVAPILGRILGSGAGQVAVGAAGGALLDTGVGALTNLLGFGGGMTFTELGPPPVNAQGRRKSAITFIDPNTGRPVIYKSQGTALLTTGDISGARKVQRVARRAARGRRRQPRLQAAMAIPRGGTHLVCGSCLTSPCGCK